jgi:hypothetical protein
MQGIVTLSDLLVRLPRLTPGQKRFGIELIRVLEVREAIPTLLTLMSERNVRLDCAWTLSMLRPGAKVIRGFLDIGRRELASTTPDRHWLDAVIQGLGLADDPRVTELFVKIFERVDLPGWLRGDAADKLGCCRHNRDRRTQLYRRCRDTAMRGLTDASIDVQFWSMYLIGSLCSNQRPQRRSLHSDFESVLPRLRQIAAKDHRLAPGYWWPMSAEAEDIICCIKTGQWRDPDAAERWSGYSMRGEQIRD